MPVLDTKHPRQETGAARDVLLLSLCNSWGFASVPFTSCHHPLRAERQSEALPPGKRVSAFWMRASTMPTTWMEETEAKSSCTGSLGGRSGGGIREGLLGN